MNIVLRAAAIGALFGLAGCVGAPAPGPVGYAQPGYSVPPGYSVGAPAGPPPGYSAPPPGYAAAAPVQPAAYGHTCYAGVYTCQLAENLPVGAQCSCPGLGAPSFGNVR